ncbi:hypothetical protein [Thalassospira sp.]|uniref:hypothetical protein n=1 Tax=Thalassospira sp. TaxID=1912094 RepID=UPI000C606B65|nr:hypothetical protein [Thalassospira sp.]MBC05687.1 hypothetical protein [Thalassospira sp.]|tara:strand:- start:4970 stop:5497 length:528 start_codon:yes stop_codon:yes gene_type:complete
MRYFKINSGPLKTKAEDYRRRHATAYDAAQDFARKYGGTRFWSGINGRLIGITASQKPGPEWVKDKRQGYWHPSNDKRKKDAAAIWDEIRALPCIPGHDRRSSEIAQWLDIHQSCRCQLGYEPDLLYLFLTDKDMFGFSVKGQLEIIANMAVPEGCEEISEAKLQMLLDERKEAA